MTDAAAEATTAANEWDAPAGTAEGWGAAPPAAADADAAVTALSEKGNKMKDGSILRKEAEATIVALERIEDGPQLKAIRRADEVRLHVPEAAHSDSGSVGMTPPVDEQGRNSRERPPTGTWV